MINLGTPAAPSMLEVSKYLREFLYDPRVIELSAFWRWLLVNLYIVPCRAKRVAHAYAAIWEEQGSPLLVNSQKIQIELQKIVDPNYQIVLGMRYGQPSIEQALKLLQDNNVDVIKVLPLFPQYASAVNGSALASVLRILSKNKAIPTCILQSDFFDHPLYINAMAQSIQPYLNHAHDYVLFSYHGLPQQQALSGKYCYRTKCFSTAELIAAKLGMPQHKWGVSFQSRLGRLAWIRPYTDDMLIELRKQGVSNLLVVCPSFIVDCLETLEEIGIRAVAQWRDLGGTSLQLIPCLNAQPHWIAALKTMLVE